MGQNFKTNHVKHFQYSMPNPVKQEPPDPRFATLSLSFSLSKEQEPGFLEMLKQAVADVKESITKG